MLSSPLAVLAAMTTFEKQHATEAATPIKHSCGHELEEMTIEDILGENIPVLTKKVEK